MKTQLISILIAIAYMTKKIFIDTGLLSLIYDDDSGNIYNNFLGITNNCGIQIRSPKTPNLNSCKK